ncbi:hypothetical protein D6D19_10660 [Aureobasidium pullulans]|uniref:Uncharacterized protein n=1 Tax=Aureobasidium pullulans TaxID=5580 RepID=A0A4S8YW54_AURPU|nr:hypothetical protein D6D19_10660 [Aureobasidium pullulans]
MRYWLRKLVHVALEFLHQIHRTELRWEVRDRVDVLIVSLVDLNVSFRPFHLGIKGVFPKTAHSANLCFRSFSPHRTHHTQYGGVLILADDGVDDVDDDQDGGVRLDTFETVRTASPRSFSPCLTSSCSSHSPRPPSSRPSSSAALIHQDMIMASLSGNDDLRNIDWIRLALAEGRYHVRAWEILQVDWSFQDNNLEVEHTRLSILLHPNPNIHQCNHAAPRTGPDGKAVDVFSSPGVLLCEDARSPDCRVWWHILLNRPKCDIWFCKPCDRLQAKTRDNRLKNEKHRQKPAKQRRNVERAGKREEYGLAQQQLAQKGVSQL